MTDLPSAVWNGRKVLVMRVRGSAMVADGIRDGDHLVVEPRDALDDGQTVLVDVDGGITLKRVSRDAGRRLVLAPTTSDVLALAIPAASVRILGVVVGIVRRRGFRRSEPFAADADRDARTFDLRLGAIERSVGEAERLATMRRGRSAERLRELGRGLRALRDCYLTTRVPRLREALLREAGEIVSRLRRFDTELGRGVRESP